MNVTAPPNHPAEQRRLSDGTSCPLPLRYSDARVLVATFLADLERAGALLQGTGLFPVPQEDGKAVVGYAFFEYRVTDIGAYNEVAVYILAVKPGDMMPAVYITDLPVTTAFADRAGREIWGYNKFLTAIEIAGDGKKFSSTLRDPDGAVIATLDGTRSLSAPAAPAGVLTFSMLDGKLIKTLIEVSAPSHIGSGDGFVLKVGPSQHRTANNLRTLELDGARPVLVQYVNPFQAVLHGGQAV